MILFFILIGFLALTFVSLLLIPLLIARFVLSLLFLIIFVPLFALIAYWYLGGAVLIHELLNQQQQTVQIQTQMEQFKSPAEVINAMQIQLQAHPDDAKGWYLVGKLYLDQQDYSHAAEALAKARQLQANNLDIMTSYAQALFFLNNRSLSPQIAQLLNTVLKQDPNNMDALNLFAVGAYNAKEYSVALRYWQRLLVLLPENSEEQKSVLEMIDKTQELNVEQKQPH